MEHTVIIWSKLKIPLGESSGYIIETKIKLTDSDIEELALQKFKDERSSLNTNREYFGELEETKH